METSELSISEAKEYLLGLFRALLEIDKFREYVDTNYVIKQYFSEDGQVLRVEINPRDGRDALEQEIPDVVH